MSMYDTEENEHHIHIIYNLLICRQIHQHINPNEKKQEFQYTNSKHTENLKIKSLT